MNKITLIKFSFIYRIFLCFLVLLLIEGVFHFYYYLISQKFTFITYKEQTGYNNIIWSENGLVELLQVFFLLISIILFFNFLKKNFNYLNLNLKALKLLYLLGILYYFFEEISWGQHFFGWQTTEFFSKINTQNETNFHNTSSVFNELPRNLLLIWCSLSFVFVRLINDKFNRFKKFLLPNINLRFISILILVFVIPDLLIDKFSLAPGHPALNNNEILLNIFYEIISFNFIRLSELQELLFNFYILFHSYYLMNLKLS